MKVFARDGSLPDDSLVASADVAPDESPIDVEQRPFEPSLASLDGSSGRKRERRCQAGAAETQPESQKLPARPQRTQTRT